MGLIKAAVSAIGSTLHDQWKEAIRCEEMGNDILMMKKTTKNGVISNGSTIIVGQGQCAIIYDNGKVIDATAEEGYYKFDTSSTPSMFEGECLKKCGKDSHIMELQVSNKQYSSLI